MPLVQSQVVLEDESYEGVLLPYGVGMFLEPSHLLESIRANSMTPDREPVFCYDFIEHGGGDGGPGIPHVEDAATQSDRYRSRFEAEEGSVTSTLKLPRRLEFPPSNARGLANPFARLPWEAWWADAYTAPAE